MTNLVASYSPPPGLGADAPDSELHASHSPVEIPTPPDEMMLGEAVSSDRAHVAPAKEVPRLFSPLYARAMDEKPVASPLAALYRASQFDAPSRSAFRYAGFRPFGVSPFQMSAERQSRKEDDEAMDDADMSVDDVFSVASQRDGRHERVTSADVDVIDAPEASPHFVSRSCENDDVPPALESSLSSSGRAPVPVPNRASSSASSRRLSMRSVGSPVETGALSMTPGTSARRSPYNVPSRSPGAMGSLNQAYAMGMTPSHGMPRVPPRLPHWAGQPRAWVRRSVGPSTSAPAHASVFALDDDETDEEPGLPDDDATEDEGETVRVRGVAPSFSRSPSPAYDDDDMSTQYRRSRTRDERYVYAGVRGASAARVRGAPSARAAPGGVLYASSVPSRRTYTPWSADDTQQRTQVHMAAAALDRLSMGGEYDEAPRRDGLPRVVDENDEVAAIRDRLGGAANCSAFISKLWHLMINPDLYGKYIRWNEAGDTIILSNDPGIAAEFASDVLPKLFKHGNNASFVRQLNLYGFQRVSSSRLLDAAELQALSARSARGGGGASDALPFRKSPTAYNTAAELYGAHSSFAHPRFRRGQEQWLPSMKPRSSKKPKRPADDNNV
ncbi:hypothetical protein MBRA1_001861 [Malassezia brasiliensis]|uniref:HSF-type DNA-binding domain-containing protein n=1 Tax=Malassezia brasiliensis TaxID=1821822 RepID=A0AAF0DWC8_9BASI|nr:hypothetical protein MBRA1_001861 [Malassezia brasiliensis]